MAFCEVLGQERAIKMLQKALVGERLAHAYLFYGPSGVGKKLAACQFIKALYCSATSPDACGACAACRKITDGNHPDVVWVTAEETSIKIDQVRTIQHRLSYKPYEQQRSTVVFDGCEKLTLPAANALLKTLEEPPANTLLLLLTGHKDALPVTIVSRCQLVPFVPLTAAHLYTIFTRHGMEPESARLAAALAEGQADRFAAENFSRTLDLRQTAYTVLQDVTHTKSMTPFLQARQLAGKREQCEELLHWLSLFLRDLTVLKVAPSARLYNDDLQMDLAPIAQRAPLYQLIDAFAQLQQFRSYLSLNSNPQLIFEQSLMQIHQTLTAQVPTQRP
jgi:DNA polymerase-3 subunit delta'